VSPIRARVPGHFCLFLTMPTAKMSSAQRCSRITFETTWSAGSSGRGRWDSVSSAWKTSFSSPGVLWSLHGLTPRFSAALRQRKFLWSIRRIRVRGVLRSATSKEMWYGTVVASSQSVRVTFGRYPLISFLKEKFKLTSGPGSMHLYQGLPSKAPFILDQNAGSGRTPS